jgi:hypothetical protein
MLQQPSWERRVIACGCWMDPPWRPARNDSNRRGLSRRGAARPVAGCVPAGMRPGGDRVPAEDAHAQERALMGRCWRECGRCWSECGSGAWPLPTPVRGGAAEEGGTRRDGYLPRRPHRPTSRPSARAPHREFLRGVEPYTSIHLRLHVWCGMPTGLPPGHASTSTLGSAKPSLQRIQLKESQLGRTFFVTSAGGRLLPSRESFQGPRCSAVS